MRSLSKLETYLMLIGGLLMVVGAGASVLLRSWAPYVFAPGALLFATMQMRQRYEGTNVTVKRLRHIMLLSCVLFLVAALNFFGLDYITYLKYVHNNWIVVLLVAAILQLYTSHRIANEIEKEAKKR